VTSEARVSASCGRRWDRFHEYFGLSGSTKDLPDLNVISHCSISATRVRNGHPRADNHHAMRVARTKLGRGRCSTVAGSVTGTMPKTLTTNGASTITCGAMM